MAIAATGVDAADAIPSEAEVQALLEKEPFSTTTWPAWRERLLGWFDDRDRRADAAFTAGRAFILSQVDKNDALPSPLADDYLAWYFFGHGALFETKTHPGPNQAQELKRAEKALRKSIELNPKFGRPHRSLAMIHMTRGETDKTEYPKATAELNRAKELDPKLVLHDLEGHLALLQGYWVDAEAHFRKGLAADPDDQQAAVGIAHCVLMQGKYPQKRSTVVGDLSRRFPQNGALVSYLGAAKASENDVRGAMAEFDRARALGVEPRQVFSDEFIDAVEDAAAPSWPERLGWVMLYFAGAYAALMALMALAGLVLANFTRGRQALSLLNTEVAPLLRNAEITRVGGETWLARLYGLALFAGLVLFYASLPFVVVGLLGGTLALLYGIFMLGRVPVKLVAVIVIIGLTMVWVVLKSIFSKPASGSFGLKKNEEQIPRVYAVAREVAARIGTEPVDEVYLGPGSSIGVHQEGRGPFGIFGKKRRVLTLGMSALHCLTIGELQAVLAHEYAHFSHQDTFYNRFIYQVQLSIERALRGMGMAAGKLNYVNPFFWFLYLYHRSYNLLASGYSRSREYLADRMACHLYGSNVFVSSLKKICTEGSFFETAMYQNIGVLLQSNESYANMYESFAQVREEQFSEAERKEFYDKSLDEKTSLFASHPTFRERVEAVADLPIAADANPRPASELVDERAKIEEELTMFITRHIYTMQRIAAG